ncbi:cytochrome P450 sterol C22-desaturase [Vararia minispora EC-137]|uniref:Cytochrome P450 sterol C22-desaturase n=1 Tax=Vararia minispora EC-137 TaxID=1314806 RepID=A0ACB8QTX9_9AGAM|nr:cytochrome P450 sterol C22-desaturase [Vararia minispora EC-137]
MASVFKSSAQASMPSSTAAAIYAFPIPSVFTTASNVLTWGYTVLAIVVALLALEQSVYRLKKRHLPGDAWTIPVIGKYADSLKPTMEGYMKQWNAGALSALSVFNIFIVMASSNEYSRKILNSPNHAEPCLVYSAKQIICPDNWVFLTGKQHVEYRKGLNLLFAHKALGYVSIMDATTRKHYNEWLQNGGKAKPIMMRIRELNMITSLRVFCGRHISDAAAKEISDRYWDITCALELVNFPLPLPGTKVYRAIQCRKIALKHLMDAAAASKVAMANGHEPECMLEHWVALLNDPSYKGRKDFSDREMALVVFSFLFASQDAMSSGLTYAFQHLVDNPHMLAKVREEQARVRGADYSAPMMLSMLDDMPYLRAFVKESMRVKPPVVMVPYKATKAFPISEDYTVPAGSMVIPSFYNSLHDPEVFPEPEDLQPERWMDPESSANKNPRNYLVFGSGPHKCIGLEYASMNIELCIALAATMMDWEHVRTSESDRIKIIATLFPADDLVMRFTPRTNA